MTHAAAHDGASTPQRERTDFVQPLHFMEESEALFGVVTTLDEATFNRPTGFKAWTINDILAHLHIWNWALEKAILEPPAFSAFLLQLKSGLKGASLRSLENDWVAPLGGHALADAWLSQARRSMAAVQSVDPGLRTPWFGPDMSARSNITARLMETWAHGQTVYDMLGLERGDSDRIKDVAFLGVNTFEWTFRVRKLQPPAVRPHVRLFAASGATWTWNSTSESDLVEGSAMEFCQVVTQVRNVADTRLRVIGEVARLWMEHAQCFAGPAHPPPAPGTRFREPAARHGGS